MLDRRTLISDMREHLGMPPSDPLIPPLTPPPDTPRRLSAADALAHLSRLVAPPPRVHEIVDVVAETAPPSLVDERPSPQAAPRVRHDHPPAESSTPVSSGAAPAATAPPVSAAPPAAAARWQPDVTLAGAQVALPEVVLGGDETAWAEVIEWARRLQEGDWERAGRADGLSLRRDITAARQLLVARDPGWAHAVVRAFSQTSLIDPPAQKAFRAWMDEPEHQRQMAHAWAVIDQPGALQERVEAFLDAFVSHKDGGPLSQGARLGLASALLSPLGDIPFYRPTTARVLGTIVDHPVPSNRAPEPERWAAFAHLAAQVRARATLAGLHMADGADLLGTMVWVAEGPAFMAKRDRAPGRVLDPEEQEAFWDWHRRRMPSRKLPTPPARSPRR